MEQYVIAMTLDDKIDVSSISTLKVILDQLPIKASSQVLDARNVTHIDSATCQLFYAYSQHLITHNTTLIFLSPSDKFTTVVQALGFDVYFNYALV
ncbi:STAS domain-containing protein [Moritella sp. 28]|uniref:STAS domain-containing protein n=1 Tax=Moritella sp. 28 TaxID=2746232 RepID=UPI001BA989D2|nr:STAS domain-containing protein [Moritella sp. 28]QUM86916.1 hypothetical protein HWV02_21765 [Moritella sp. 28]